MGLGPKNLQPCMLHASTSAGNFMTKEKQVCCDVANGRYKDDQHGIGR